MAEVGGRILPRNLWPRVSGMRQEKQLLEERLVTPLASPDLADRFGDTELRHALKPALMPVLSYLGPALAQIVTGSVVIEQVFSIPGLGRHFVQGALNRDYTVVMGVVLFYGALIVLLNLVVDLLYGLLDPRVRHR